MKYLDCHRDLEYRIKIKCYRRWVSEWWQCHGIVPSFVDESLSAGCTEMRKQVSKRDRAVSFEQLKFSIVTLLYCWCESFIWFIDWVLYILQLVYLIFYLINYEPARTNPELIKYSGFGLICFIFISAWITL